MEPELTEELITAAMAKAEARVCVGPDRCFAFADRPEDALARAAPRKGAARQGPDLGPSDYLDELTRRQRERESQRLADQTAALIRLTGVLAVLTAGLFFLEVLRIAGIVH